MACDPDQHPDRADTPAASSRDRRTIWIILALVAAGWLAALALMAFAAVYWDHG